MENERKKIVYESDQGIKMNRMVLNSRNSEEVRKTIDELSAYLMEKNEKLYRKLANQP